MREPQNPEVFVFRFSMLALLTLAACDPSRDEVPDAGLIPLVPVEYPKSPIGTGGSGGNGDSDPVSGERVNLAEKIWLAQEDVFRTSARLRSSYGENALSWLRAVRNSTGSQLTTGKYVERADGTSTYTSGGDTLRVTSVSGRSFELRVHSLVGDVSSSNFPQAGESVDVSWLFSGTEARLALGYRWSRIEGTFATEEGELMDVDLRDSEDSTTYTGTNSTGSGYQTDTFGNKSYEGFVEFADRRVDISTSVVYSTCNGSCGSTSNQDFVFSHSTKLTIDGSVANLNYTTGWTKQSPSSLNQYRWEGTIRGSVSGELVKRAVAGGAEALDVVIGADRYTTRGVATP